MANEPVNKQVALSQNLLKFPYGLSDFRRIILEKQFYIDRTGLIPALEQAGEQLLFLRPRRFGKSLWLSTIENYYDLARADQFETLFAHLNIGRSPTANHNRYFILGWDFSLIDANGDYEHIVRSIDDHINSSIEYFSACYHDYLPAPIPTHEGNSLRSFRSLLAALQPLGHPLYLLIDEYDNFAYEVMASRLQGRKRYDELVQGEGIIKTLFKAVKSAASGMGLEKVFITGVSPIVMSDITSGYNVVKNISHHAKFSALCGFTAQEVLPVTQKIAAECQLQPEAADEAILMMQRFYNGYRFSEKVQDKIYNPTLTLYFWDEWKNSCAYPAKMLDSNLAMDRNRIHYIASLPHGESIIEQLLDTTQVLSIESLADEFGVEAILDDPPDAAFLISLLTYFGVLTIDGVNELGELTLTIPNQVIRSLYVERIQTTLSSGYEENELRQSVALNVNQPVAFS